MPHPRPETGSSTVEEAAAILGTSTDWLYRNRWQLPFARTLGRQVRFSERGLRAWLAEGSKLNGQDR